MSNSFPSCDPQQTSGSYYLREGMPFTDGNLPEIHLAQVLHRSGPACTQSEEVFNAVLNENPNILLDAMSISKAIIILTNPVITEAPNGNSWNIEVFVRVLQDRCPDFKWRDVFECFDCRELEMISYDRFFGAVDILLTGIKLNNDTFPVEVLYRKWKNRDAQMSWVRKIIEHPDVLCLGDYEHTEVDTSILKVQPEDGNKHAANWKCLELYDLVVEYGNEDQKNATLAFEISLLEASKCPDLFLLGLCQSKSVFDGFRLELVKATLPELLHAYNGSSQANMMAVLNFMWNLDVVLDGKDSDKGLQPYILYALVNLYKFNQIQSDITKITRILEIAHELKPNCLSELLNYPTSYQFLVELAVVASKRDFLKLDKWLDDKAKQHGQYFVDVVLVNAKQIVRSVFPNYNGQNAPEAITALSNFLMRHKKDGTGSFSPSPLQQQPQSYSGYELKSDGRSSLSSPRANYGPSFNTVPQQGITPFPPVLSNTRLPDLMYNSFIGGFSNNINLTHNEMLASFNQMNQMPHSGMQSQFGQSSFAGQSGNLSPMMMPGMQQQQSQTSSSQLPQSQRAASGNYLRNNEFCGFKSKSAANHITKEWGGGKDFCDIGQQVSRVSEINGKGKNVKYTRKKHNIKRQSSTDQAFDFRKKIRIVKKNELLMKL